MSAEPHSRHRIATRMRHSVPVTHMLMPRRCHIHAAAPFRKIMLVQYCLVRWIAGLHTEGRTCLGESRVTLVSDFVGSWLKHDVGGLTAAPGASRSHPRVVEGAVGTACVGARSARCAIGRLAVSKPQRTRRIILGFWTGKGLTKVNNALPQELAWGKLHRVLAILPSNVPRRGV